MFGKYFKLKSNFLAIEEIGVDGAIIDHVTEIDLE
jgi:hypothetical protein